MSFSEQLAPPSVDIDQTLSSPYEFSLADITADISPSDNPHEVLNAFHALTRLTTIDHLSPADVAMQLATEAHGSPVTHNHVVVLFGMAPDYFNSLSEDEIRFFLACGMNHTLAELQNRFTAAVTGLIPMESQDICAVHQKIIHLQEKKGRLFSKKNSTVLNNGNTSA